MERNIILLTGLFAPNDYESIIQNSKGNVQFAADALQKSIVIGLLSYEEIQIVNLPFVGSYPRRYKKPRIDSFTFSSIGNETVVKGTNVSFCNVTGIKLLDRYIRAKRALQSKIADDKDNIIFVYSIHTPFLLACRDLKRQYRNVKVILISPDLPEYMSQKETCVRSLLVSMNKYVLKHCYQFVDGYVLLTDYMKERLPVGSKPYTVIEGIYNQKDECDLIQQNDSREQYILYTGTLARRYGILNLVKAFMSVKIDNLKLYICGEGEARDEIIRLSNLDSRIKYIGQIKREEALYLQRSAKLLVNPRSPEGEFTKYSFPSKVMEYLASGTPTLMCRLPGIPDEYYNYCYSMDNNEVYALAEALLKIFEIPERYRFEMGQRARDYILQKKNPKSQTKKIVDLLANL